VFSEKDHAIDYAQNRAQLRRLLPVRTKVSFSIIRTAELALKAQLKRVVETIMDSSDGVVEAFVPNACFFVSTLI
jgi:hypothetical protein